MYLLSRVRSVAKKSSSLLRRSSSSWSSVSWSSPAEETVYLYSSDSGVGGGGGGGGGGAKKESEKEVEQSTVYRRALVTRRPPTLKAQKSQWNSCSFIGSVVFPTKRYNCKRADQFGVYTLLDVKSRPSALSFTQSSPSFKILVEFWDGLAEIALRHLWVDDLIYVWGHLQSYKGTNRNGHPEVFQKLYVKELNYVRGSTHVQGCPNEENLEDVTKTISGKNEIEMDHRDRLKLWQVFFASPEEWWDNRKLKTNPRQPDFRHKDTHESLTVKPDDPPWVRKQLELCDSEFLGRRRANDWIGSRKLSEWKFDE